MCSGLMISRHVLDVWVAVSSGVWLLRHVFFGHYLAPIAQILVSPQVKFVLHHVLLHIGHLARLV